MKTARLKINGIVQGVGFRPFVHRLAKKCHLKGWIRNTTFGAELMLQGKKEDILSFVMAVEDEAPSLAAIEKVEMQHMETEELFSEFSIIESDGRGERRTLISPDVAICPDCLRELRDKKDRRYGYPFINCTNCGPRFTIIRDVPYDRKNTSMAGFAMCTKCQEEYESIEDRRYHAQPDCCEDCGPKVEYVEDNKICHEDPIKKSRELLKAGKILAIKGIGGFHLACLAESQAAVNELRRRKQRDDKPFAIMCRDTEAAKKFCLINEDEKRILESSKRPIVLLNKKGQKAFEYLSENGYVGVMLPYTPLHYLIFEDGIESLVMTSANLSDMPIMYDNNEALEGLKDIADGFLINNRDIVNRCDDSLLWVIEGNEYFVRRSRGYVPYPLTLENVDGVLACGAEQKASFAIARDGYVFPGAHIGDLKNLETYDNYIEQIRHFEKLFDADISCVACDMHPDYMSTAYARERTEKDNLQLIQVQHHHAHMAACMADNKLEGDCIGIVWDGTGFGTDGTIWGSEFLAGGYDKVKRFASFKCIRLPGGDKAAKEIQRSAISLLEDAGIDSRQFFGGAKADLVRNMLGAEVNCPKSSGMGRLFDAVSAILGIATEASYEGRGAVLLEACAIDDEKSYSFEIINNNSEAGYVYENGTPKYIIDTAPMVRDMVADIRAGVSKEVMAGRFMNTLVKAAVKMCCIISSETGLNRIMLSGGSFQDMYVLGRIKEQLSREGLQVFTHRRVSCNDEGVSFGQCAVAASWILKNSRE